MSLYGLILGICFTIGITYFYRHNKNVPKKQEDFFIFSTLVSGIIGARVYGVIADWSYFSQNPIQILNLRGGGLGIFGGLIGAITFILFFCFKNKINLLPVLNALAPIIPLCQSLGRWGNFFNHEIYSATGQPVWFYESILMFLIFLFLKKAKNHQTGIYLISYGIIRFILEFIRTDTIGIFYLTLGQILGFLFILIGLFITKYENTRHQSRINHD
ncbi:MAG: prolipoprotein diacylglyceryl transferase [Candidatus Shapirobacteria bacterium]|nr:prolipoprotein diacylglyceryl transferase [Candidatus Shapirobacteria bacterium]